MIAKANYFGCLPLGSDVMIDEIKIMQSQWTAYTKPVFLFGKKQGINPCFCDLFYIKQGGKAVLFAAYEQGLGNYHIFTISGKNAQRIKEKLLRK